MEQIALGASLAGQAAGAMAEGALGQVVTHDVTGVPGPLCERSGPLRMAACAGFPPP